MSRRTALFFSTHGLTTVVLWRGLILEGKAVRNEAEHVTFILKPEVKKSWVFTSTVPLVLVVQYVSALTTFLYFVVFCLETLKAPCET